MTEQTAASDTGVESTGPAQIDTRTFARDWVRSTWYGWLLGIPIIIVLALIGDLFGGAQVVVGAGMGAGIGLMQGRLVRRLLARMSPWVWSSIIGLSIPFLFADVAGPIGIDIQFSLYWAVAFGGLFVGAWQAAILHARFRDTSLWIIASAIGWTLAGATTALADVLQQSNALPGIPGALAYLALVALGGVVLGLVTAPALVRFLRHETPLT